MILDINTVLSSNQAITVTAVSQNVLDLAGVGVGQAAPNTFGVQATSFGEDIGGSGPATSAPQLLARVGSAALVGQGNSTLQVQLQCAVDTNNTGTAGTWETIAETDAIAEALLVAGANIANFTVPDRYLGQGFPRFYRLNYVVANGPFVSGAIGYAGILTGVDDAPAYPSGF